MAIVFLLALLSGSAWAACPCLSSYPAIVSPADGVTIGGQVYYSYPQTYGLSSCAAHDLNLEPFCNTGDPSDTPGWCDDSWCYVDKNNCDKPVTESHYFTGVDLYFSYFSCGNQNTFTSWFGDDGTDTTGAQGETLADLVGVMHSYLKASTNILEETEIELRSAAASYPSLCSGVNPGCPCEGCSTLNTFNNASLNFAQTSTTPRPGASTTSEDAVLERCMASSLSSNFLRTAGAESDLARIGYTYSGFQSLGTYTQWPAADTCSWDYDPRYRPWYVSAASGPKDVVIILDVSGSMNTNGRLGLAKAAAAALIDTLTDNDYVNLITFSTGATIAPFGDGAHLVKATPSVRAELTAYVNGLTAGGTTNFNEALSSALDLLENPYLTSGCTKTILFLSDGTPTGGTWETDQASTVASRAATTHARIFTYALGASAPTDELKAIACDNRGALWAVADGGNLADAMVDYFTFLAPLNPPCQVRWRGYNDSITGEPLLAACLPAYKKQTAISATSCAGGTAGEVPELLGVTCMDVSLIVDKEVLDARPDAAAFYALVDADQAACSATTPTEAQLQTLRSRITFGDAVCPGVPVPTSPSPPTPTVFSFQVLVEGELVEDFTDTIRTEMKNKVAAALSGISSADITLEIISARRTGKPLLSFTVSTTTDVLASHMATIEGLINTDDDAEAFLSTASNTVTVLAVWGVYEGWPVYDSGPNNETVVIIGVAAAVLALCLVVIYKVRNNNKRKRARADKTLSAASTASTAAPEAVVPMMGEVPMGLPVMAEPQLAGQYPTAP